jgi:hypothetical protein
MNWILIVLALSFDMVEDDSLDGLVMVIGAHSNI